MPLVSICDKRDTIHNRHVGFGNRTYFQTAHHRFGRTNAPFDKAQIGFKVFDKALARAVRHGGKRRLGYRTLVVLTDVKHEIARSFIENKHGVAGKNCVDSFILAVCYFGFGNVNTLFADFVQRQPFVGNFFRPAYYAETKLRIG